MRKNLLTLLLFFAIPPVIRADAPSFRREIVPILTRLGCNSGACHGTPTGKNGFRLSLRGYDQALDQATLTREQFARRIDFLKPGNSLILTKATGQAAHEGGKRLDPEQPQYDLLVRWILAGAPDDRATAPARLVITPTKLTLADTNATQTIRVSAVFGSDAPVDVTHLVRFSTSDETIARITLDGEVRPIKRGEVTVIAEYMGIMITATVLIREPGTKVAWETPASTNPIDPLVFAKLRELGIEPSGICSDAEFVRRAHLDAIGRLPTPERVQTFLADNRGNKRELLIDELLNRDAFADWWAQKWADRLGVNQRFVGKIGAGKFHRWIRHQMATNVPEDAFVRSILTASGGNYSNPPAGFYRRLRDPMLRAEEISQLFLGVRIGCARCHNHPGERWTQDDYYHLAAFFNRIEYRQGPLFIQIYDKEETVISSHNGELTQPRTGKIAEPKFLGGATPDLGSDGDRRDAFAAWLTTPENPFFAKASANRLWFHLFGKGLVDPVDDFRISNPASHPEVLDFLAKEFASQKFDRKKMIRLIMNSRVYQLSSATNESNHDDERFFSHNLVRRLGAEQLLDAISEASGSKAKFPGMPAGVPAVALPDGEYKNPFLEAFGRPARAMACECEREADTSLSQALHLAGGKSFDAQIRSDDGRIAKLIQAGKSDSQIVDELFLATLSRLPSATERESIEKHVSTASKESRRKSHENLLHALINHPEFVFQH